jgi:type II secretory pathway pseudopilin PulG
VELIVVLSIFAVLSSVAIFNYGSFQDKVDIKNLGSDVALKIVEAQKSALSGLFPQQLLVSPLTWKPSYGVYFFDGSGSSQGANTQNFIYFSDLDYSAPSQNALFDDSDCVGECVSKISITKNNVISKLEVLGTGCPGTVTNLTIVFKRPDSRAIISATPAFSCTISSAQITVTSPKLNSSLIKVFPSGRIEVK